MPDAAPWAVYVVPEAQTDLRRLRRVARKTSQEAERLIDSLEVDPTPTTLGEACHPPLPEGVRRAHFWNDEYRLVWKVLVQERRVDVLAVGPKDDGGIYRQAQLRLLLPPGLET